MGRTDLFLLIVLVASSIVLAACDSPPCSEFDRAERVDEYEWNGARYYLVTPECCDQYIELYTTDCDYVCAPSGGFSGDGDGKCPGDFSAEATFIETVYP